MRKRHGDGIGRERRTCRGGGGRSRGQVRERDVIFVSPGVSRVDDVTLAQRGNVSHKNLTVINAILYVAENGSKLASPAQALWHMAYGL